MLGIWSTLGKHFLHPVGCGSVFLAKSCWDAWWSGSKLARGQVNRVSHFSCSVVSDSLQPQESQHARPPCPSPTPRVHSDSCPSSQWCHPAISSSVVPFPPAPNPSQHQSLFQWVNSLHKVAKVLEFQLSIIPSKEIPGLISFRMDWLDLLAVQGTLKSLLHTTVQKHQFFGAQLSSQSNSHIHTWLLEKP